MKNLFLVSTVLFITACSSSFSPPVNQWWFGKSSEKVTYHTTKVKYSNDTLVIFYDKNVGDRYLLDAVEKTKSQIIYRYSMMNGMAIKLDKSVNLESSINYFKNVKGVLSVEKDNVSIIE